MHRELERHDMPAKHITRREGRPYTLVLTKRTEAVA